MEKLSERCRRICGSPDADCFIRNREQLSCIADMVINKVSGVQAFIESAAEEYRSDRAARFLDEASKNIQELVNWVKFLQISHDLHTLRSLICETRDSEARRETRYPLPEIYHKYIVMKVNVSGSFVPVTLVNFSRCGLQFKCPRPLEVDSLSEGVLYTAAPTENRIAFRVRARYCVKLDEEYTVGGRIEGMTEGAIFDFFNDVHDLILDAISRPEAGPS